MYINIQIVIDYIRPIVRLTIILGDERLFIGDSLNELIRSKKELQKIAKEENEREYVKWFNELMFKINFLNLSNNQSNKPSNSPSNAPSFDQYLRLKRFGNQFGQKLYKELMIQWEKRFPIAWIHQRYTMYKWAMIDVLNIRNYRTFVNVFKDSLNQFMTFYDLHTPIHQNDIKGIYILIKDRKKITSATQFWNELFSTQLSSNLLSIVDQYRCLTAATTSVERCHKAKNVLHKRNYKYSAVNILLFINQNAPSYGSSDYYKVIDRATNYFVLLKSKKYRERMKCIIDGE